MDPLGYLQELVIVLLLIGANGILALLEMALVSARKSRVEQMAASSKGAAYILQLAQEPTEFLSTVQIGITLVGIGTGVYSGAAFAAPLAAVLRYASGMEAYARPLAYGLVVALVTYLSIIFGELLPKRCAINAPEALIVRCSALVRVLVALFKPFTFLLNVSTRYLLQLLHVKGREEQPVSEDELRLLIEQGASSGVFNNEEKRIMLSALELDRLRVSAVMTPRTQIGWLNIRSSDEEQLAQMSERRYSAFVIADEDLDHVLGIVYTKRLLLDGLKRQRLDLKRHIRQPLYVPENMRIDTLLKKFQQERVKIALVVDEFGAVAGMVTLRDVVERLLGSVPSFDEKAEQKIIRRSENSWLVDGLLPLDRFIERFALEETAAEQVSRRYNTVGGLMVALLGHIPVEGEGVTLASWQLEIVDMDGNRIDKILVSRIAAKELQ